MRTSALAIATAFTFLVVGRAGAVPIIGADPEGTAVAVADMAADPAAATTTTTAGPAATDSTTAVRAAAGAAIADFAGAPLMVVSPPQYLWLDPRAKLRSQPLIGDGVGFGLAAGGEGMSNVGYEVGVAEVPPSLGGGGLVTIPEPTMLLLVGSGLAWSLRRRLSSRRQA